MSAIDDHVPRLQALGFDGTSIEQFAKLWKPLQDEPKYRALVGLAR